MARPGPSRRVLGIISSFLPDFVRAVRAARPRGLSYFAPGIAYRAS
jgi:hypothetical protein